MSVKNFELSLKPIIDGVGVIPAGGYNSSINVMSTAVGIFDYDKLPRRIQYLFMELYRNDDRFNQYCQSHKTPDNINDPPSHLDDPPGHVDDPPSHWDDPP